MSSQAKLAAVQQAVQQALHLVQQMQSEAPAALKIVNVSHVENLHCDQETKTIVLGKVGMSGKLRAFNYDLIAKDQGWGNKHGSLFEIYIQHHGNQVATTGNVWCSRYDGAPTFSDRPNDHINEHATVNCGSEVQADDEIVIKLSGLYGGHSVDVSNIHVRLAVE